MKKIQFNAELIDHMLYDEGFQNDVELLGFDKAMIKLGKWLYTKGSCLADYARTLPGGSEYYPPSYNKERITMDKELQNYAIVEIIRLLYDISIVVHGSYGDKITPKAAIMAYRDSMTDAEWEAQAKKTTRYIDIDTLRTSIYESNGEIVPEDKQEIISAEEAIKMIELIWYGNEGKGSVYWVTREAQRLEAVKEEIKNVHGIGAKRVMKQKIKAALNSGSQTYDCIRDYYKTMHIDPSFPKSLEAKERYLDENEMTVHWD